MPVLIKNRFEINCQKIVLQSVAEEVLNLHREIVFLNTSGSCYELRLHSHFIFNIRAMLIYRKPSLQDIICCNASQSKKLTGRTPNYTVASISWWNSNLTSCQLPGYWTL